MKKLLTFLILCVSLFVFAATGAMAGTYGDLTYSISDGEVTITNYTGGETDVEIPATIEGYPVTSIGNYAFRNCSSLISITIPKSVTSIGDSAFWDCTGLESVYITDMAAYLNCAYSGILSCPMSYADKLYLNGELIKDLVIPESVTEIPEYAFDGCLSLQSVTITSSVTSVGDYAFNGCKGISDVYITDLVAYLDCKYGRFCSPMMYGGELYLNGELVRDDVVIPEGATKILDYAFNGCGSLTSITIPDGIASIGKNAFSECDNLESASIAGSVKKIGNSAFDSCDKLSNLTLGEGIEEIGIFAFGSCESIEKVKLPSTIKTIDSYAFACCDNLKGIWIDGDVYYIANDAFKYCDNLTIYGVADSYAETYANKNNIPFVAGPLPDGYYSISGSVKTAFRDSYGSKVTLLLGDKELESYNKYWDYTYCFDDITPGTYTLRVSAYKYCTRDYTVTVADGDVTQDVEIWLYGDVNGDGVVNAKDVLQINRKIAGLTSVFDNGDEALKAYRDDVANVTAITGTDEVINAKDVLQINRKIAGLSSVFDRL